MKEDIQLNPVRADNTEPDFHLLFSATFEFLKQIIAANHVATAFELDQFLCATPDTHIDRLAGDIVGMIEASWDDIADELGQYRVREPVQTIERNTLT